MPLASIHLVSLSKTSSLQDFIEALLSSELKVLVISKVVRWIIRPEKIDVDPLLEPPKPWDLLIICLGDSPLPKALSSQIECQWSTKAGIPSRLTTEFQAKNEKLLHPASKVPLTGSLKNPRLGSTSQTLELSSDLQSWVSTFSKTNAGGGAVSMLNLLAFKPDMHPSYLQYGKAFGESIGAKRGGNAKLVGNVIADPDDPKQAKGVGWDEMALAHYPSILHFADMLASEDYQAVNLKFRVPSLRDTCILCTSELEVEELLQGQGKGGSRSKSGEVKEAKL
jgi:hypothetical protein